MEIKQEPCFSLFGADEIAAAEEWYALLPSPPPAFPPPPAPMSPVSVPKQERCITFPPTVKRRRAAVKQAPLTTPALPKAPKAAKDGASKRKSHHRIVVSGPAALLVSQQLLLPLDDEVIACGTVPAATGALADVAPLGALGALQTSADACLSPVSSCSAAAGFSPKKKRERPVEADPATGEWVDVRIFDRNPVSIEDAERLEMNALVMPGTYFVSLARKRIAGIVELHKRWLSKTKNSCSDYGDVQKDLMDFFAKSLLDFDARYASYVSHPLFESIGKTRKRLSSSTGGGVSSASATPSPAIAGWSLSPALAATQPMPN